MSTQPGLIGSRRRPMPASASDGGYSAAGEKENALMRERKERLGDRLGRHQTALIAMEVALGERDLAFVGFEKPSSGSGVIAVAINGERRLMHLGRDEADAMFRLAHLASLRA